MAQKLDSISIFRIVNMKESELVTFIEFWKEAYEGDNYDWNDYLTFIAINKPLSKEYVLRACQWKKGRKWKDGVYPENFGKNWSEYIKAWMNEPTLDYLENVKKNGEIVETLFKKFEELGTFSSIRMQSFIAHTVRPFDFPILDENVWRSFVYLTKAGLSNKLNYTIKDYLDYKKFFDSLVEEYEKDFDKRTASFDDRLRKRKDIDDALMAFGQFLKVYGNLPHLRDEEGGNDG